MTGRIVRGRSVKIFKSFIHPMRFCRLGFTFTGGVEQSRLEAGQRRVRQRVFDGHLDSESRVWVHIRQGQQVGGAHEEVPVERMDGQT